MILDYTGGLSKSFYKWHVGSSQSDMKTEARTGVMMCFAERQRGREPRNAHGFQEAG